MDDQERLAHNLVKFRKASGLTQIELAEKIKYSNKTVSKWERAESYPDIFTLKKIADTYGVTVNDILEGVMPTDVSEREDEAKASPMYPIKRNILVISCALMLCITSVAFFVLMFVVGAGRTANGGVIVSAFASSGFPYWVFFFYNIPLDAIACFIFMLVVHKHAEKWCLSAILWGSLLSIQLSIMYINALTALIYILGVPFQILISNFCRYVNLAINHGEKVAKGSKIIKD
ncbi:MAG: helix-turn-helix transcriptional regulator [Clostridia bacterium]|nr:helix-turn-helix transcriptional regulator [Clostridia bacterium]